ncbi:natural killer cells antigen CD94-like [Xenentodon cancila]
MMLHSATHDSRCVLCSNSWLGWRNHCYFFSFAQLENRHWNESAEFCQQLNSSLAVIKDSAEMFVMVLWDAGHRDCADLRGDRGLFAADCEEYGPWARWTPAFRL